MKPAETVVFTQLALVFNKQVEMEDAHEAAANNSPNYAKIHAALPDIHITLKLWLAVISNGDDKQADFFITTVGSAEDILQWAAKYGGMIPCE
jgi:hypothetical protein